MGKILVGLILAALGTVGVVAANMAANNRSGPPDVVVIPKPPDHELVVFIHRPVKPSQARGGQSTCPAKTMGKWRTKSLSFSVNPNDQVARADGTALTADEVVASVTSGFTPWDAASGLTAPTVLTFAGLPSTYETETRNGVNEIAWASLSAKGYSNAIAVTYVWRITTTKEIVEADMVNNSDAGFDWVNHDVTGDPDTASVATTGKFDLPNIDTHEFGHFVGLDHVEETQQTMYRFSSTDEVKKRSLECGDEKGAQKNYGAQ